MKSAVLARPRRSSSCCMRFYNLICLRFFLLTFFVIKPECRVDILFVSGAAAVRTVLRSVSAPAERSSSKGTAAVAVAYRVGLPPYGSSDSRTVPAQGLYRIPAPGGTHPTIRPMRVRRIPGPISNRSRPNARFGRLGIPEQRSDNQKVKSSLTYKK